MLLRHEALGIWRNHYAKMGKIMHYALFKINYADYTDVKLYWSNMDIMEYY